MELKTKKICLNADLYTPVSMYLNLRDHYCRPLLLETSNQHSKQDSLSVICLEPFALFEVFGNCTEQVVNGEICSIEYSSIPQVVQQFSEFRQKFEFDDANASLPVNNCFGFTSYDFAEAQQGIKLFPNAIKGDVPLLSYAFYKLVLVFDHFRNEVTLYSHSENEQEALDNLEILIHKMEKRNAYDFPFATIGLPKTDCTDAEFINLVETGKQHCRLGDVFQIVLSKRLSVEFAGDEFQVYRSLRNINPSPYMFYFDFNSFKIFGSSPEAQLIVKNGIAEIHPIAGTIKRSGTVETDIALAKKLSEDEKENAEHVMLIDLARNDLSKDCVDVKVERYREIEVYSHLMHMVSKVSGRLVKGKDVFELLINSFPAGTLTGAPKRRAMQLIAENEKSKRGFYGGAVGFLGKDSTCVHAIIIRSAMSVGKTLSLRAGAGVVINSSPNGELAEVENKLEAMITAVKKASQTKELVQEFYIN